MNDMEKIIKLREHLERIRFYAESRSILSKHERECWEFVVTEAALALKDTEAT